MIEMSRYTGYKMVEFSLLFVIKFCLRLKRPKIN